MDSVHTPTRRRVAAAARALRAGKPATPRSPLADVDRERFFQLTLDMLCVAGFDGYFKHVNPAWGKVLGHSNEDLLATPYINFVHPDDRPATIAEAGKLGAGGATVTFENRYRCKDGSYKWLQWNARAVQDEELIYAAARDVTERKHSDEQLRSANAALAENERAMREALVVIKQSHEDLIQTQLQLIQMEKMNSVGRLAAGVAHEVKNPLAVLLMGVDYLTRTYPEAAGNTAAVLHAMRHAVKRADVIIRGLVDFSASRKLELRQHDPNAVLKQALLMIKHELEVNRIRLVEELDEKLPPLPLDETKMEQVFINVLTNASHAMVGGGTLTCRTRAHRFAPAFEGEGPRCISSFNDGDMLVRIDIEDTGPGISAEHLARLFEPFFTTKPTGKGTGLGLTVSRKIIELHEGSLDVINRAEGGVRVSIFLKAGEGA